MIPQQRDDPAGPLDCLREFASRGIGDELQQTEEIGLAAPFGPTKRLSEPGFQVLLRKDRNPSTSRRCTAIVPSNHQDLNCNGRIGCGRACFEILRV